jgi:ribosomal protein S10
MFFYLKVSCKDKKILKKFTSFLTKIKSLSIFIKPFSKKKKRKFITVLKSPHVNKTAQEQFEYRFFSKSFLVFSFKPSIFFLLLKKLKNFSFSGIKLEVKGLFEKDATYKHALKLINPDNVVLTNKHLNQSSLKKSEKKYENARRTFNAGSSEFRLSKKYIQLFDSYGEICLRNVFYL